jgi:hypothetical protein
MIGSLSRWLGEHGVDGEAVVHRRHAHQVPGEAEVGPVDVHLGVEPDLAVAGMDAAASNDRRRVRPRTVSAGHGDTRARGPDTVRGEDDVRMAAAVEEVGRAQVPVAPDAAATLA